MQTISVLSLKMRIKLCMKPREQNRSVTKIQFRPDYWPKHVGEDITMKVHQ